MTRKRPVILSLIQKTTPGGIVFIFLLLTDLDRFNFDL